MKASIVEVFETIQGEGHNVGLPSIFVRFWGCNLRCRFNGEQCDTPYAVFKERNRATEMTPEALVEHIVRFRSKNIVFTGGEPTLFQEFIIETVELLNEDYYEFEVETNGTIPLNDTFKSMINQFNVSVKLKSSNQKNKIFNSKRINKDALDTFPIGRTYFKFVICNEEDLKEVKTLERMYMFPVYLMPQGSTRTEVIKNSPSVIKICMDNNYRFSPREHIIIYSKKRGV